MRQKAEAVIAPERTEEVFATENTRTTDSI